MMYRNARYVGDSIFGNSAFYMDSRDFKTFMGCNSKVHLCHFYVSATGLNCLPRLAHW